MNFLPRLLEAARDISGAGEGSLETFGAGAGDLAFLESWAQKSLSESLLTSSSLRWMYRWFGLEKTNNKTVLLAGSFTIKWVDIPGH